MGPCVGLGGVCLCVTFFCGRRFLCSTVFFFSLTGNSNWRGPVWFPVCKRVWRSGCIQYAGAIRPAASLLWPCLDELVAQVNYLIIESLRRYHVFYGDEFKVGLRLERGGGTGRRAAAPLVLQPHDPVGVELAKRKRAGAAMLSRLPLLPADCGANGLGQHDDAERGCPRDCPPPHEHFSKGGRWRFGQTWTARPLAWTAPPAPLR